MMPGSHLLKDIPMRVLHTEMRDEHTTLLQACYDNPQFSEDIVVGNNAMEDRFQLATQNADLDKDIYRGQKHEYIRRVSSSTVKPKDYFHTFEHPASFQEVPISQKRQRYINIFVIFLAFASIFSIIVGLVVHLRNSGLSRRLHGSLMIIRGPFSVYLDAYKDNSSSQFMIFSNTFQYEMNSIFRHSTFRSMYDETRVEKIQSNLIVQFFILLKLEFQITLRDLQDISELIIFGLKSSVFAVQDTTVNITAEYFIPSTTPKLPEKCEEIHALECINMSYSSISLPNIFGHWTQHEAKYALMHVLSNLSEFCHGYVRNFLCGLYFPKCGPQSSSIYPCRAFCQAGKCLPIRSELCLLEGFNTTSFPNLLGSTGEMEVAHVVMLMKGMNAATKCYKYSMLFACAAYLPPCSGNSTIGFNFIPPCRSLCQAYRDRCEIFLDIFYQPWPKELICDKLPDSNDSNVCVGYKEAHYLLELGDCDPGKMTCDGNRCIESQWVCDGYQDCQDFTDEENCAECEPYETVCSPFSMLCVNTSDICNGNDDCYKGTDENVCVRIGDANDSRVLEAYNGESFEWEEICSAGFNQTFATMSCRQLGFGRDACPQGNEYVVKLTCWKHVCGTRPARYSSPLRVVGGSEVKPGTWPWMVSLHGGSDQKFFCGGTVINPSWVLTAGHCVGGGARETSYWTLVAGQNRRSAYSRFRQLRKPKKLFLHPQFDHTTINNDIALIQLATPLEFTHYLQPICLPRSGDEVDIGTRCYVAGWGKTDTFAHDYEDSVKEVSLDVVTRESCLTAIQKSDFPLPYKLTEKMLCAGGSGGHDACQGDSGGPFMCRVPNITDTWYQAGIVSWGIGCAVPNAPGIYTKLSLYVDWIYQTIANNPGT